MAPLLAAAQASQLGTSFLQCTQSPSSSARAGAASSVKAAPLRIVASASAQGPSPGGEPHLSRRQLSLASAAGLLATVAAPLPALADFKETYTAETQTVIDKVRAMLSLEKTDPARPDAVNELRGVSNDWVAKYRREKSVAGLPSFSNMYSVLNAISGHYISFGPTYPIPKKRQDRIFEEIDIAERALTRGR